MSDLAEVEVLVYGRVQGVFYRAFAARQAQALGLTGYVRNLYGGNAVEVRAEGERVKLERLVELLKTGPPAAKVEKISATWSEYQGTFPDFTVKHFSR